MAKRYDSKHRLLRTGEYFFEFLSGNDGCREKMDRESLGLGTYTGLALYLFWRPDPARRYRLSRDPAA